jgi:hypothetical protein
MAKMKPPIVPEQPVPIVSEDGRPEGERRSVVAVQAEEVGPSLRWATAKPERATNGRGGQFNDDPPF